MFFSGFVSSIATSTRSLERQELALSTTTSSLVLTSITSSVCLYATLSLCINTNPNKDKLSEGFPYWERLHGYWRTLPNYNPVTVTSDPGQDLESNAVALVGMALNGDGNDEESVPDGNELTPEEPAEIELDPDANADDDMYAADNGVSLFLPFVFIHTH